MDFDPVIVGAVFAAALVVVVLVAIVRAMAGSRQRRARMADQPSGVNTVGGANGKGSPVPETASDLRRRPDAGQTSTAADFVASAGARSPEVTSPKPPPETVLAQVTVSNLDWPADSPAPTGVQLVNAVPVRMSAVGEPSALRLTASGDQIGVGCNFVINVAPLNLGGVDVASLRIVAEFALAGGSLHGANINTYWSVGQTASELQVFDLHELCGDGEPGKLCRIELPLSPPLASAERLRVQFRVRNKVGSYRGGLPDVAIDLYGVTLTGVRN